MLRTQGTFGGWQHLADAARESSGTLGWVCNRVLTTSNGVTVGAVSMAMAARRGNVLVSAVIVEPAVAATSFAWKGSMTTSEVCGKTRGKWES